MIDKHLVKAALASHQALLCYTEWERIANAPMTPDRAAFYALREKNVAQLRSAFMSNILSDHNCEGQAAAIYDAQRSYP